jgi:curli biogenesis system outer membrane secretion channel CsgG
MKRMLAAAFLPGHGGSSGTSSGTHRAMVASVLALLFAANVFGQSPAPKSPSALVAPGKAGPSASSGVDTVIALVKGGMSDALVIKTLRREGKVYTLTAADLLKLQKAGVSETIIEAMTDPGVAVAASGPSAARPAVVPATRTVAESPVVEAAGAATPFPPDLTEPVVRKRRLAVKPFDYSTVMNWVTYWFSNPVNIGEGIRAMLTVRLQQSPTLTLLERTNITDLMREQDLGASNRVRKGTNARIGQLSGADCMLYGDIVIFGRDDTTKRKGLGAALGAFAPAVGAAVAFNRTEKAVVGINLRLVDAETGEVIETAEAKGESSRSSKDYAGLLGVKAVGVVAASGMTSSNFQQTIIGEATSNAVTNIVKYLETKVPQLPAKARQIEGRVASVTTNGAYLTVGGEDGVLRGDRFEILKINGEIKDPTTKEVIDLDAVKVGELVVDNVREKTATGAYGGQPLSATYTTSGKGYAARLISKQ